MRLLKAVILLFFLTPAYGYQVQPMLQELDVAGRGSYGDYLVFNHNNNEVTLEISIFQISFNDEYEEVLIPADDDFLILPPQTVIQPQASQTFRLRYIPNENLTTSTAYRVVFDQVPLDVDEDDQSLVQFMMRFSTIVIVNVPTTEPLPVVFNQIKQGRPEITIKNTGNGVLDLTEWTFNFTINGENKVYRWLDMESTLNQRYLMPGAALIVEQFAMEEINNESIDKIYLNSLMTK
ncbi:fimbria/pilus periplasmic chaperone [Photobacterium rosenbergii]|uniref:Fimbria/pilus periplasmic chaperone n=1 Tax=Photobacterium rosenbergii TaxID=294936 RepID=A0ABU3ZJW2_9GAMM|nr:fimbria/pilus periplasmic chaperone [Photobacterium rosenbergii]MDV5170401.1 fimbria/pilus periplasmic chaperone [Photobacterium rosenbergii]